MTHVARLHVPVKLRLKLGAIVGLHDVNTERQPLQDSVDEADGRALITRIVDLEDANARAIIDGRELVQALARAGNALEELDVHLEPVARLRLLVAAPAFVVGPMLLIAR